MITILDNEITGDECNSIIELGIKNLKPARVLGKEIPGYRTAENGWIYETTPLLKNLKERISSLTNLPIENQEHPQIVKYEIGGEYKQHHDFFHTNQPYYDSVTKQGGQRFFSCLYYLNSDFTGGETHFPIKNITITPRVGRLLIWKNIKENGELDHDSLHSGLPVISGTKWILIIWVREKQYTTVK